MRERRKVTTALNEGYPLIIPKINRNDKCQCGSGKKQKKCCGMEKVYYTTKPKPKEEPKPVVKGTKELTPDDFKNIDPLRQEKSTGIHPGH